MRVARLSRAGIVAASFAALVVSACDEVAPEPEAAAPAAAVAPVAAAVPAAPRYEAKWEATPPATLEVTPTGNKVALTAKGMVNSVYFGLAVKAGETVVAKLDVSGDVDKVLRVVLIRHCNSEAGEEAASEGFKLTAEPKSVTIKRTFAADYGCVRLSFLSQDGAPLNATIANVAIDKQQ